MKYTKYNKEDFLKDEYFQKWLLDPDPMVTRFWESWLEKHPEKREVIEQASKIMRSIDFRRDELPEKTLMRCGRISLRKEASARVS